MASGLRSSFLLLTLFTALKTAAPQRGHRQQDSPPWEQQPSQTSSQRPVVIQTVDPNSNPSVSFQGGSSSQVALPSSSAFGSSPVVPSNVIGGPTDTATNTAPTGTGTSVGNNRGKTGGKTGDMTPSSKKAGIAGTNGVSLLGDHISWYYDWSPSPQGGGSGIPASMVRKPRIGVLETLIRRFLWEWSTDNCLELWGGGHVDSTDAERHSQLLALSTKPDWLLGFNEPDCGPRASANLQPEDAAKVWNSDLKLKIGSNAKVGSPAPCRQQGDWLDQFKAADPSMDWGFTAVHIYRDDASKVGPALNMVDLLEGDDRVAAYSAITEGYKLPPG
ncbi:MAG: hypothetical protein MMC23_006200 [Stictis urceolatum]|nr:hypothetical protein [Stictis urceolata]